MCLPTELFAGLARRQEELIAVQQAVAEHAFGVVLQTEKVGFHEFRIRAQQQHANFDRLVARRRRR